LAGDSYRRIICLIPVGKMGEDHDGYDDQ
jgi:hypothetical protein